MSAETGIYLQIILLLAATTVWISLRAMNEYRRLKGWQRPVLATPETEELPQPLQLSEGPIQDVPGAAHALYQPTSHLERTIVEMHRHHKQPDGKPEPYGFPIGWVNADGTPSLVSAHLINDVYHTLITAQSRAGKDVLATNILLSLALQHPPRQLQICVIDGKGLDFVGWEGKSHTWRLALEPEQIKPAMDALTQERQRRGAVLRAAQVSKWENYRGDDLPLLVVYVSELTLLEDAVGKNDLTSWLNSELAAGAAFGIRYMIATQTASNFATRWRSQISLYLAGFQPSQSQDAPNTGLTGNEIRSPWAAPPSELPPPPAGAGVFTCIQGREAMTVRSGNLSDDDRARWLARLPDSVDRSTVETPGRSAIETPALQGVSPTASDRVSTALEPAKTVLQPSTATTANTGQLTVISAPKVDVSEAERVSILSAVEQLTTDGKKPSRRQICERVFGSPGGENYQKVKVVLDALEAQAMAA